MTRPLIALLAALFLFQIAANGQSDRPAARAIQLLKNLESEVIVYDSLGDFQESGKLAHVPFEVFRQDLDKVSTEVEFILSRLPQNKLKNEIRNALDSYQDGAFWWEKIFPKRVVSVSQLVAADVGPSTANRHYSATIPYTIAINWRHGTRYLKRAQKLLE